MTKKSTQRASADNTDISEQPQRFQSLSNDQLVELHSDFKRSKAWLEAIEANDRMGCFLLGSGAMLEWLNAQGLVRSSDG